MEIYTEVHGSLTFYTFESVIERTSSSQFKNQRQANSAEGTESKSRDSERQLAVLDENLKGFRKAKAHEQEHILFSTLKSCVYDVCECGRYVCDV